VATTEAGTSEARPDQYLEDISDDEESANTPQTRLLKQTKPDATATRSEQTDASGFGKLYPSAISTRTRTKLQI
jgi:hypothetical protein